MRQHIVDVFTTRLFRGNQAAVCLPEQWPDDELMKHIARENNFSETAFAMPTHTGAGDAPEYRLRWFTPAAEIDFCGHATLGTAYVLHRFVCPDAERIVFHTKVGALTVHVHDGMFDMDFPAYQLHEVSVTPKMTAAISVEPRYAFLNRDLMLVLDDAQQVREITVDIDTAAQLDWLCLALTAPGRDIDGTRYDCVSRVFAPKMGIAEDPVTGSSHCMIAPYWSERLHKTTLRAW